MREIVFDTETTGLSFSGGDRLVEIGCVEMINRCETGRTFHSYVNPQRPMSPDAQKVHGLSDAFLADKPIFADIADALIDFVGDAPLVAHNAAFDFGFLNGELEHCGRRLIDMERMVDTLAIAKRSHPGAKLTLDALCVRFGIDRSRRVLHGALLDAQLLAQVYVELMGGRQIGLGLTAETILVETHVRQVQAIVRPPRVFSASAEELARHASFIDQITSPLWRDQAAG